MNRELQGRFFSAMMRFKKTGAGFSADCEMQMSELAVLQTIAGGCGCSEHAGMNLNVPEVQERLQISKPAVSYILNTLERKNYITRQIDPRDRRKIFITATPEGKSAAESSARQYDAVWSELIARFGTADMERLLELLARLSDICEELDQESQ